MKNLTKEVNKIILKNIYKKGYNAEFLLYWNKNIKNNFKNIKLLNLIWNKTNPNLVSQLIIQVDSNPQKLMLIHQNIREELKNTINENYFNYKCIQKIVIKVEK